MKICMSIKTFCTRLSIAALFMVSKGRQMPIIRKMDPIKYYSEVKVTNCKDT